MPTVPQVLIVDPDTESSGELHKMLASSGFTVAGTAGYGVEAISLAIQLRPDAVIMRMEEPLVRPLQTLSKITDGMPDIPVVVFSSEANLKIVRQAMIAGASDYLNEPLVAEELESSIMRVLERKEREGMRRRGELPAPVPQGTIITVFGAKGGIGKTTISSNLAVALVQEAQQSVCLVDMDTRFGDVAITMDIPVERSIADLARNLDTVDRSNLKDYLVKHSSGVWILPAPTRPSDWRNLSSRHIRDVVDVLAQTHDFVILDTPGTFNEIVAAGIEVGTLIILVTTLDMASIKDSVLALEMLHDRFGNDSERIKIILNRAGIDTGVRERDVEQTLDAPLWWRIPQDNDVVKSAQIGKPIVMHRPNSKVSIEIREMARALAGVREKKPSSISRRNASGGGGALARIFPFLKKSA